MRRLRVIVAALALLAVAAGAGTPTFSAFTKTTSNASDRLQSARIFPRDRIVPSWQITDASSGTPTATSATTVAPLAFSDTAGTVGYVQSSNAFNTFASNRYIDVEMGDLAPAGLVPTSVTAEIDFSDAANRSPGACMYLETRRLSTDQLIATDATQTCSTTTTAVTTQRTLTGITSTDIANDLKLRLYFNESGKGAIRLHRVVIKSVVLGDTYTSLPEKYSDQLDTTPAAVTWSLGNVDATAWVDATKWPTAYTATKYASFAFPSTLPSGAAPVAATLSYTWRSPGATNMCLSFEVYASGTLIGTHGGTTTATAQSCTTSSTFATLTVPLSEVNTATRANNLTVKVYAWGPTANTIEFDRVALVTNWGLPPV